MSAGGADVRGQLGTLRRRAHVLALAVLVGLLGGFAYVVVVPTSLTSTTLVLLPTPAVAESSSSDVDTQVRIAESADILARAGEAADPDLTMRQIERMVSVQATTNQLLEIGVTSTNGVQAQRLSGAVAEAYVNYVRDTAREVTAAALNDLSNRRDDLQAQIQQLQKEINASLQRQKSIKPNSSEGRAEARLLGNLRTQQGSLALQLDRVQDKLAAGAPLGSSATGTSVIQQATVALGPSILLRLAVSVPAGGLTAAVLATVIILLIARRDRRLRMRDDIADAIGSPVLAAARSRPQRTVAGWSTLLDRYEATPVESWALRQVLRGLSGHRGTRVAGRVEHPQSVTLISLSGDFGGVALGVQLAAFAASLGVDTRLTPALGHDSVSSLWACATEGSEPNRPHLHLGGPVEGESVGLTVYLVVVERTRPQLEGIPLSESTILAVSSGNATAQELARLAVSVDDAGRTIAGVMVADPDPSDRTSGRHTLDERSSWPALPSRLTGTNGEEVRRGRP